MSNAQPDCRYYYVVCQSGRLAAPGLMACVVRGILPFVAAGGGWQIPSSIHYPEFRKALPIVTDWRELSDAEAADFLASRTDLPAEAGPFLWKIG